MNNLFQLILVGAFFALLLGVFVWIVLTELYRWYLDRTARKIRKRRGKLRMIREYREGKL